MNTQDDITAAIVGIRSRLDTLARINADNIAAPGGPQSRYHQIVEEAYAALGLNEAQIDELRTELEYQHKHLDEIRDAALPGKKDLLEVKEKETKTSWKAAAALLMILF